MLLSLDWATLRARAWTALRTRGRLLLSVGATLVVVLPLAWMWQSSRLPDSYDVASMGYPDWGGGPVDDMGGIAHGVPVVDLVEDSDRPADVRVTLTVRRESSGRYTVNGTSPGPTLEATVGDMVEVTLVNENVSDGITLHPHGVDVPNAADGVAGVTQDAVGPGESFVYRFVPDGAGTFWYHSHQISHEQVRRGLLGAIVIHPKNPDPAVTDQLALLHRYDGATLNGKEGTTTVDAAAGDQVRLRVINTDNGLTALWVTGSPFEVLAVDGIDVNEPGSVADKRVRVPAGGRVDIGLTVPPAGVRVDFGGTTAMVFGSDPTVGQQTRMPRDFLDLLAYGEPTDIGFDPTSPDRRFEFRIGKRPGFLDGRPGMFWTINGHMFPHVPMYMVREGDVAVFTVQNNSDESHPMHLHGHHAVVLSRNGQAATGSPWWVDSLEVGVGETYEIALVADNPGIWMDHCHNLPHAVQGLVAHLMYTGVRSSYRVGGDANNVPE